MKVISFLKKIIILVIMIQTMMIFTEVNTCSAVNWNDIITSGREWINKGKDPSRKIDEEHSIGYDMIHFSEEDVSKSAEDIFWTLYIFGIVLSVIVGGILGIKFMLASVDEKANIKEAMIPYVAGCIVIFGAFGIWKFAVEILNRLE